MAHWHDFNPWAAELIYIPNEYDAAWMIQHSVIPSEEIEAWYKRSPKIDIYMLYDGPLTQGFTREHHLGIRYGKEEREYIPPYIDQRRARLVWKKYSSPQLNITPQSP